MKLQIFLFSYAHGFAAWKQSWNIEQPAKLQDLIQPISHFLVSLLVLDDAQYSHQ